MRPPILSLALALGVASVRGHISMIYQEGQVGPIRAANGPTSDSPASVQTPCGGEATYGANGKGSVQDEATVSLVMRYAAGHQGSFRMAFACGGADIEAPASTLTVANGCTATGAQGAYGDNGARAVGQNEMTITCTLPARSNAQPEDCTIAILDQRQWAGCVDVSLLPAAAPLPPNGPPAPFVMAGGLYNFRADRLVDTSAGQVTLPNGATYTYSCCALSAGGLRIADYTPGDATVRGTLEGAQAFNCPATTPIKEPTPLPPPPNDRTIDLTAGIPGGQIAFTVSDGGNKLTAQNVQLDGQPYEIIVNSGSSEGPLLALVNTGGLQPVICDGTSALGLAAGGGGGDGDEGVSHGVVAVIVIVILFSVVGFAGYCFCGQRGTGGKYPPPPGVTMSQAPPPPGPPPPAGALPPGWSEQLDPNTGAPYFYNAGTGQTTWVRPGGERV